MLHLLRSCNLMLPTYGDNFFICFFFFFSHFSKGLQRQEVELQLQHGTHALFIVRVFLVGDVAGLISGVPLRVITIAHISNKVEEGTLVGGRGRG